MRHITQTRILSNIKELNPTENEITVEVNPKLRSNNVPVLLKGNQIVEEEGFQN